VLQVEEEEEYDLVCPIPEAWYLVLNLLNAPPPFPAAAVTELLLAALSALLYPSLFFSCELMCKESSSLSPLL
jgi:hypothetical protein